MTNFPHHPNPEQQPFCEAFIRRYHVDLAIGIYEIDEHGFFFTVEEFHQQFLIFIHCGISFFIFGFMLELMEIRVDFAEI